MEKLKQETFQAICCEHFTCIDLLQVEIINDPMGRQSTTDDDTLKKKFSATAKIAALLSSGYIFYIKFVYIFTLLKYEVYAWWNVQVKCFKICHIFEI